MNRTPFVAAIIAFLILLQGCATTSQKAPRSLSLDEYLVGTWHGEKYNWREDHFYTWDTTIRADGTYSVELNFYYKNGSKEKVKENGKWWIEDGIFHQIAPDLMSKPDRYEMIIIDDVTLAKRILSWDTSAINAYEGKTYLQKRIN